MTLSLLRWNAWRAHPCANTTRGDARERARRLIFASPCSLLLATMAAPTLGAQPRRVKKDPFHAGQQLEFPRGWSRAQDCAQSFFDCLFLWDSKDCEAVEAVLRDLKNTTLREQRQANDDWLWERVRREIPPPAELVSRLDMWFQFWKDHKDQHGNLIFSGDRLATWNNIRKLAAEGYLSDHPNVQLYFPKLKDGYGLQTYFCARGTNKNEAFHGQIEDHVATENVGIETGAAKVQQYTFEHNVTAERRHVPGTPNFVHFNLDLIEKQDAFYMHLFGQQLHPGHRHVMQYKVTAAGSGVIPKSVEEDKSARLPKIQGRSRPWEGYSGDAKFLSEEGGSLIPYCGVASDEERKLYSRLALRFDNKDFDGMAREWENHVDGKTVFRKKPYHLSDYWSTYEKSARRISEIRKEQSEGRSHFLFPTLRQTTGPAPAPFVAPDVEMAEADSGQPLFIPNPLLGTHSQPSAHTATLNPNLSHTSPRRRGKRKPKRCMVCKEAGREDTMGACPGRGDRRRCPYNVAAEPGSPPAGRAAKRRHQGATPPRPPAVPLVQPVAQPVFLRARRGGSN